MQFIAQFGRTRPTQSRILLGSVIVIFGTVSIILSAIAEYRGSGASADLVVSFFGDLLHGNPDALVPFCIGCFLELLPLATLLLTVRARSWPSQAV
jgi:hypothetical protein